MEAAKAQNIMGFQPVQDDLNVEIITDVLAKLRTVESILEKEEDKLEEPFEMEEKVEVAAETAQNVPEVAVGERTPIVFMKDYLFNIENVQNLFNTPIFHTYVKIVCRLGPLHGEPSNFSIPFPQFPYD